MRMHTHGKWSTNILLGALIVFSIIVLYNYWSISTLNKDLLQDVRVLEKRLIEQSKNNDALQANLEKMQEIKERVEGNLKKVELIDEKEKKEIINKDHKIRTLQNEIENLKMNSENCKNTLGTSEAKVVKIELEISELKGKVVSLEAQLVEKNNKLSRMEKALMEKKSSSSSNSPAVELAQNNEQPQPVLLNDPAVSHPSGWMLPHGSVNQVKHVVVKSEADKGVKRTRKMGPVIIIDPPDKPRSKARFSVLDRPKNEMKPDSAKQVASLQKPMNQENEPNGGGEDFGGAGQPPAGVIPAPGHRGDQHEAQNLDAAEDDGIEDRVLKDDFGQLDDQSPDGALQKDGINNNGNGNGVIQAPDVNAKQGEGEAIDHRHHR